MNKTKRIAFLLMGTSMTFILQAMADPAICYKKVEIMDFDPHLKILADQNGNSTAKDYAGINIHDKDDNTSMRIYRRKDPNNNDLRQWCRIQMKKISGPNEDLFTQIPWSNGSEAPRCFNEDATLSVTSSAGSKIAIKYEADDDRFSVYHVDKDQRPTTQPAIHVDPINPDDRSRAAGYSIGFQSGGMVNGSIRMIQLPRFNDFISDKNSTFHLESADQNSKFEKSSECGEPIKLKSSALSKTKSNGHKSNVTQPVFIPSPSGKGTLGI